MSYRSRIDWWLVIVLAATLVSCFLSLAPTLGVALALLLVLLLVLVLMLLLWPCEYRLEPERLSIRSGLLNWRVRYADITGAELSYDPTAAPALSLRRVKIRTTGRTFLVSPLDRQAFIDALMQRVHNAG